MRAWILAGGASRRYGSDKALADVDGIPMVLRVADTLREAGLEPVVLARHARGLPLREVIEPDAPTRHPLFGVACALGHEADDGGSDGALVCPVDAWPLQGAQVRALYTARAVARVNPLVGWWPAWAQGACVEGARTGARVRAVAQACALPALDVGPVGNRNEPAHPARTA